MKEQQHILEKIFFDDKGAGAARVNKDIIVKVRMTQAQVEALDRAVAGSPADTRSAWVRWAIQQALQAAKTGKEH